jgi:hypothetical protein
MIFQQVIFSRRMLGLYLKVSYCHFLSHYSPFTIHIHLHNRLHTTCTVKRMSLNKLRMWDTCIEQGGHGRHGDMLTFDWKEPQTFVTCISVYRRVLHWMIVFIDTLYTQLGTSGNYTTIADIHTLQFTVTHALGFPVFTSRILATDLSQSHCNFKSYMKSSLHSLIPSLPFLLNHPGLPFPELDPVLDNNELFFNWTLSASDNN